MNWLTEIYWFVKYKIEDTILVIKDKLNKDNSYDSPFVGEEYVAEVKDKPKKKKAKKKSKNKK